MSSWSFTVHGATNLKNTDDDGLSDPYCNVYLIDQSGKKLKKTKSKVIKDNLNPVWKFNAFKMKDCDHTTYRSVVVEVFDKDKYSADDFLGQVVVPFSKICASAYNGKEQTIVLDLRSKSGKSFVGQIKLLSTFNRAVLDFKSINQEDDVPDLPIDDVRGKKRLQVPSSSDPTKKTDFFELPKFDSSPKADEDYFNVEHGLWFGTACHLAYKKGGYVTQVAKKIWGMEDARFFEDKDTDTQAFATFNNEIVILCFRGTESIRDWATNVDFLMDSDPFPEYKGHGIKIHHGFNSSLMSVWLEINDFLDYAFKLHPKLKLFICGHSLGGALANLAFAHFTLGYPRRTVDRVYTVGQPRAGNRRLKAILSDKAAHTIYKRIVNNNDVVPYLAKGQQYGDLIYISRNGNLVKKATSWQITMDKLKGLKERCSLLDGFEDHSVPIYRKLLEKAHTKFDLAVINGNGDVYAKLTALLDLIYAIVDNIEAALSFKVELRTSKSNMELVSRLFKGLSRFICLLKPAEKGDVSNLLGQCKEKFEALEDITDQCTQRMNALQIHQLNYAEQISSLNSDIGGLAGQIKEKLQELRARKEKIHELEQKYSLTFDMNDDETYSTDFQSITSSTSPLDDAIAECTKAYSDKDFTTAESKANEILESAKDEANIVFALYVLFCIACTSNNGTAATWLKKLTEYNIDKHQIQDAIEGTAAANDPEIKDLCAKVYTVSAYEDILYPAEIDQLTKFFNQADVNGDSKLTVKEFKQHLETIPLIELLALLGWEDPDKSTEEINQIITNMENSRKGFVYIDEFLGFFSNIIPKEDARHGVLKQVTKRESNLNVIRRASRNTISEPK